MDKVVRADGLPGFGFLVLELARQRVGPGQRHLAVDIGRVAVRLEIATATANATATASAAASASAASTAFGAGRRHRVRPIPSRSAGFHRALRVVRRSVPPARVVVVVVHPRIIQMMRR